MRDPLLRETDDGDGIEVGDDYGVDAGDECDEVGCSLRVLYDKCGDLVVDFDSVLGPNRTKKQPWPNQHDEDATHEDTVQNCMFQALKEGASWDLVIAGVADVARWW